MFRTGALRTPRARRHLGLVALRSVVSTAVLAAAFLAPAGLLAKSAVEQSATVARAELPREARATEIAIRSGGPFRYSKDGAVFGNRERRLPLESRGYYREYTVPTPGAPDRGARRIVCGGTEPAAPDACYYSADHYTSFKRIVD